MTPAAIASTTNTAAKNDVPSDQKDDDIILEPLYMPDSVLPPPRNREANSTHRLSRLDMQRAINDVKRFVEARLESDLKVVKVGVVIVFVLLHRLRKTMTRSSMSSKTHACCIFQCTI